MIKRSYMSEPLQLSQWELSDLFAARRELTRDYWGSTPNGRIVIDRQITELEIEILRREKEADRAIHPLNYKR